MFVFVDFHTIVLLISRKKSYGLIVSVIHKAAYLVKYAFRLLTVALEHGQLVLFFPTLFLQMGTQPTTDNTCDNSAG